MTGRTVMAGRVPAIRRAKGADWDGRDDPRIKSGDGHDGVWQLLA